MWDALHLVFKQVKDPLLWTNPSLLIRSDLTISFLPWTGLYCQSLNQLFSMINWRLQMINSKLIHPIKNNYMMQEKLLIMLSRSCIHIDFVERLFGLIVKVHSTTKTPFIYFLLTWAADNGTEFACQSPRISFTPISFHPAANGDTNQVERWKVFNKIHKLIKHTVQ